MLIGTSIGDGLRSAAARILASRVMTVLQAPIRISGIDIHISPSIGIAMYPDDGASIQALLAHADAAMYSAKRSGRGSFRRYSQGMHAGSEERVYLERRAARGDRVLQQFQLYYQPKVDTRTGEVRSAEALIRWCHPTRGILPPGEFIPLAEECGLIGAIGDWVVREACRQARAWQKDGVPPLRVSVNLSPSQFRDGGLVDNIRLVLADAGLDARHLEVELTESAVMSDPEQSIAVLEQLSAMGVLVSVDDFGTGYSSMSYLRRFPIDKLKIDRVFIDEIVEPSGRRVHRARHRPAGPRPAPQGHSRKASRRRRSSTFLKAAGLRPVPGLSLQPAAARGGLRAPGAGRAAGRCAERRRCGSHALQARRLR